MENNLPMEEMRQDAPEQIPPQKENQASDNKIVVVGVIIVALLVASLILFYSIGDKSPVFGDLGGTVTLSGVVVVVDVEGLTLTLASVDKEKEQTVRIDEETRLYRDFASEGGKVLTEINLINLGVGEDVEVAYNSAIGATVFDVLSITISDPRSFDEYRTTAQLPTLFHATLVQIEEGTIGILFAVASTDGVIGEQTIITFPIAEDTPVWYIADRTREHIIHTRKQASFLELVIGDEIVLEFDGDVVSDIIIPPQEN